MKFPITKTILLLLGCLCCAAGVLADDAAARAEMERATAEFDSGNYKKAGDLYGDAELLADDTVLRAGAIGRQIESYRAGGMLYKEFEAIERALDRYASYVDVVSLVDREYQIGYEYSTGKREPAFWALRWIPWLTGGDKTDEIYKAALKRGPYAARAHEARVHLAGRLVADGKSVEALDHLRETVREAGDQKYPYLFLGEQLFLLAHRGDGDGRYNREALELIGKFKKRFPDAPENDMMDKWILELKDIQGKRLLDVAKFYHRDGRNLAAERYLNEVIRRYPDSLSAAESEKMLVDLDRTYVPDGFAPEIKPRLQTYEVYPLPAEERKILILPTESDGKFLFPVYNINFGETKR